jgi:hypothetical protein
MWTFIVSWFCRSIFDGGSIGRKDSGMGEQKFKQDAALRGGADG